MALPSITPHIYIYIYIYIDPFNRPRRLLKGWHLFPFQPVEDQTQLTHQLGMQTEQAIVPSSMRIISTVR